MKFKFLLILAAVLGTMNIHAQTITGTSTAAVNEPQECSAFRLYCYGMKFNFAMSDGSNTTEWLWLNSASGGTGFIQWGTGSYTGDPLELNGGLSSVSCGALIGPISRTQPRTGQHVLCTFEGMDVASLQFSGSMDLIYTSYYSSGGGGRAGGAGDHWEITGGTITITFGKTASPDSPIAPTPVCLPGDKGGCPPHDL